MDEDDRVDVRVGFVFFLGLPEIHPPQLGLPRSWLGGGMEAGR